MNGYKVVVRVRGEDHIEYRTDSLEKAEGYARTVSGNRWGGRRVVTSDGRDVSVWDDSRKVRQ